MKFSEHEEKAAKGVIGEIRRILSELPETAEVEKLEVDCSYTTFSIQTIEIRVDPSRRLTLRLLTTKSEAA